MATAMTGAVVKLPSVILATVGIIKKDMANEDCAVAGVLEDD